MNLPPSNTPSNPETSFSNSLWVNPISLALTDTLNATVSGFQLADNVISSLSLLLIEVM